ncbi:hypothetical protein ACQEVM_19365 [Streptomyces sp. CA-243310]|uniref:hypothetical protein n=1 Tax=Streptomyces sp. CA-243310 TaxID=3240056 RepID=UPI003D8D62BB
MTWFERAEAAERLGDRDAAIALVSARAECHGDSDAHGNHLWHMDLLACAERFTELAELAHTDVHARRRLNRALRERGMDTALRRRAEEGDRGALYNLVHLLCETDRAPEAGRAVRDLAPDNAYALRLVADLGSPSPRTP